MAETYIVAGTGLYGYLSDLCQLKCFLFLPSSDSSVLCNGVVIYYDRITSVVEWMSMEQ